MHGQEQAQLAACGRGPGRAHHPPGPAAGADLHRRRGPVPRPRAAPARAAVLDRRTMQQRARELIQHYFGLSLPGSALIGELTTAQQKIVQITHALLGKASILVLDEPTAALVRREVDSLFAVIRFGARKASRSSTSPTTCRRSRPCATGSRSCATAATWAWSRWRPHPSPRSSR
ncbi:MAG: hypothetical protein U1E17_04240 [Geminicoccaceae bacterium]